MKAMPIMPIEPAKEVNSVLPFFVFRLLKLKDSAVTRDIFALSFFLCAPSARSSPPSKGLLSEMILPSCKLTIRVAYCSAREGLCVTMMTKRSFATSFKSSITCTLVPESSAPVGSSANRIFGSFTKARAIATLCICPPES